MTDVTELRTTAPDAGAGEAASATDILGIPGSLRQGSFNRALLRAAEAEASDEVRFRIYERLGSVPPYNQDEDTSDPPFPVAELRREIARADALLIATPEYNHSIPGVLKNAVDWASRPYGESVLIDKPVAVIGASPSRFGATWAQQELRKVLEATGADVVDVELSVSLAAERFDEGRLVDQEVRADLERVVASLLRQAAPDAAVA